MNNHIIYITSAVLILLGAIVSQAQWQPDPSCPYPSEHVTKYPYYGNCSIYWACYEGSKFLLECPNGLEFSAKAEECDAPEIANCDPYPSTTDGPTRSTSTNTDETTPTTTTTTTTTTITTTTTTISTTSSGPDPQCPYPSEEIIYFPFPGDCNKYYECFEGEKYLYNCPEGLWWHQEVTECDYPGDYCQNVTTITTTTSSTTSTPTTSFSPDFECPYPSEEVLYFPYPGDCNKYWECFEGDRYLYQCPPGLWWHGEVTECDYPGDYCKNSTEPFFISYN